MTVIVDIDDVKTQLSRLMERAATGEEILIARAGKPLARLVPINRREPRHPGLLKGLAVPGALFDPLPENELSRWE
jgi:prevent-host-death family protein